MLANGPMRTGKSWGYGMTFVSMEAFLRALVAALGRGLSAGSGIGTGGGKGGETIGNPP